MALTITQTKEGASGWAAVQQGNLTNIKNYVEAIETDLAGFPDELKNMTQAEIQQLENIGAITISAAQWGYLGGQTDTVDNRIDTLALLLDGTNPMAAAIDMGAFAITNVGNVDGVDVSALKTDVDGFPDELKNMTQAEIQQLENIAATTISAAQWGYLGGQTGVAGMTDRGDPAAWDFVTGDFTTDATWRDLDLSSIVPADAKTVRLRIAMVDNLTTAELNFRKKGNSNSVNASSQYTRVANITIPWETTISIDTDRKIQYNATNTTWTTIVVAVKGWWF